MSPGYGHRVFSGFRVTREILTARRINAWDAAGRANEGAKPGAPSKGAPGVLVRNTTGSTIQAGEVLELGNPIFRPDENPQAFRELRAFDVMRPESPETVSKVAVALEPIQDLTLGRAAISGPATVSAIDVVDETHERAIVLEDGRARTADDGPLVILWKDESGADPRAGVVLIAQAFKGTARIFAEITNATQSGPNRWVYDWMRVAPNPDGSAWDPLVDDGGQPITSATLGPAWNTLEAGNDANTTGIGLDPATLPGTFELIPIGEGAVVELRGPINKSETEPGFWTFQAANTLDGEC